MPGTTLYFDLSNLTEKDEVLSLSVSGKRYDLQTLADPKNGPDGKSGDSAFKGTPLC